VALNCFLLQKSVSRTTRGRSRKKKCSLSKSTDENEHSQTGQGEEIASPPAQCTSPRRGRPEEVTEMNSSIPLQTQPETGNDYYNAASAVSPNAHHQDKISSLSLTALPNQYLMLGYTDIGGSTF
jgi:hypothetical protein